MAGFATKTWSVSDAWTNAEANSYIRDPLNSVRLFQTSAAMFDDGPVTITTTPTAYASHANVMSATPGETFDMLVTMAVYLDQGATAQIVNLDIRDSANTTITLGSDQPSVIHVADVVGHGYALIATLMGKATYTAANCGFKLWASTGTGTIVARVASSVMFAPAP